MSGSYSTITAGNFELTPVRVKYTPKGGSAVDLGATLGNVAISIKIEKAEIKADQTGTTVLDRRVKGIMATITTELSEIKNKDLLKVIFPNATLTTMGLQTALDFTLGIGASDLDVAGTLLLHPLSQADSVKDFDYTFPLVVSSEESEVVYGPENQSKFKIVWNAYIDLSKTPPHLFRHGDPAVV